MAGYRRSRQGWPARGLGSRDDKLAGRIGVVRVYHARRTDNSRLTRDKDSREEERRRSEEVVEIVRKTLRHHPPLHGAFTNSMRTEKFWAR